MTLDSSRVKLSAVCGFAVAGIFIAALGQYALGETKQTAAQWPIITRTGDALFEGDRPFRFLGLDAPDLLMNESQIRPDRTNRFPDEFEIRDALDGLRRVGARATRTFTLSVFSSDDKGIPVHITGRRIYNEDAFRAMDLVLALAHEYDIRLIIPLIASQTFERIRGIDEFSALAGRPGGDFFTDEVVKSDYRDLVQTVLNRRNTVSGILYKDDPAVLAWQFGNEFNVYAPDRKLDPAQLTRRITPWMLEMAAYIKSIDRHHLVMDAGGADRAALLADPNIDMISEHLYEYWNRLTGGPAELAPLAAAARQQCKGRKVLIVDEFGLGATENLRSLMREIVDDGISGGLMWSIRSHRRDGGWYYHNEGGTLVNSFHVPGFADGTSFEETRVLDLLRREAFRIRMVSPTPLSVPSPPPVLIRLEGGFTWRGSAGASSYTLERADKPEGPWSTLAEGVQDSVVADVANFEGTPRASLPFVLYWDESAQPQTRYFYRLKAVNPAGDSGYSNILAVDSR